jgi:hypothetical protein
MELIEQAIPAPLEGASSTPAIATDNLGAIFGIELENAPITTTPETKKKPGAKTSATKTTAAKKKKSPPKKG